MLSAVKIGEESSRILSRRLTSGYVYDPDHRQHPEGGGWHKTDRGWSDCPRGKSSDGAADFKRRLLPKLNRLMDKTTIAPDVEARLKMLEHSTAVAQRKHKMYEALMEIDDRMPDDDRGFYVKQAFFQALEKQQDYVVEQFGANDGVEIRTPSVGETDDRGERAFDFVGKIVSRKVIPDGTPGPKISWVEENRHIEGLHNAREYFKDGTLYMRFDDSEVERWCHELGHWIEWSNPELQRKCKEFLDYRTEGKPLVRFKNEGQDIYKEHEVYKDGGFPEKYCGYIYSDVSNPNATEILSMGLEMLSLDPWRFYNDDKQYFCFVVGLLRGEL